MAILTSKNGTYIERDFEKIKQFLHSFGIWHDQWETTVKLSHHATQEQILDAYSPSLKPFMENGGYTTVDVIDVHADTPNISELRNKFLREHIHTEDEIRFFVDGQGLFWFHVSGEVFSLLCEAGDLISVPANTKHWFDLGKHPHVKAIRIFIDKNGWTPHYTESGIDSKYNTTY